MDTYEQVLIRLTKAYAKIASLEAERDALRADAQRYEWLREPDIWDDSAVYVRMANGNILAMSDLDNYIDAANAAKEPK